jgi:hypothetical protein
MLFGNIETIKSKSLYCYTRHAVKYLMAHYLYLEMEYNRVWCPLGLKACTVYNCISAAKMSTIKTLTGAHTVTVHAPNT